MRIINYTIATIIILTTIIASCDKIETLPSKPHIEFTSFTVVDSIDDLGNIGKKGTLIFYFEDGDGDIGTFKSSDTTTNPESDCFFTMYLKESGVFIPLVDADTSYSILIPGNFQIPYMERTGQNKIIKGTISINFDYHSTDYDTTNHDTFRYEFYLKDRAGHYSDTALTCDIPLSENGVYTE